MGRGPRHEKAELVLRLALMMQATRSGISLLEIMDAFEVSRRTAERMRDAVERVFPQMESVDSDERVKRWRIPPRSFSGLIDCTAHHLSSIHLATDMMRKKGHEDRAKDLEEIDLLLRGSMMPEKLSRIEPDLEALTIAEGIAARPSAKLELSPKIVKDLRQAIIAMQVIKIKYKGRDHKTSTKTVHPYGLLYGSKSYLVAHSPSAKSMRLWLISNIKTVEVLKEGFDRDPAFDLNTYAANSFGVFQEDPVDVELLFDADVANDVRKFHFHPTQKLKTIPNGKIKVTFTAGGLTEMCWHLFTWGASVKIIKPDALRDRLRKMCEDHIQAIRLSKPRR